jgi:small subunit ribosomal protein S5
MEHMNIDEKKFTEKLVHLGKVTKVVKGGRNFRWSALVVGDGQGHVGAALGKANEVADAIRKGAEKARKNIIKVPMVNTTIPHEIIGKFGAAKVLLKPASEGSGVIAGGPVRAVCELAGIRDIRTKSLGSPNQINIVYATIEALKQLVTVEEVAKLRGKTVDEILE